MRWLVTGASGQLGGYRAGPGWDPVTGWGSPNAAVLVPVGCLYSDFAAEQQKDR